jgi:hypothetical protein
MGTVGGPSTAATVCSPPIDRDALGRAAGDEAGDENASALPVAMPR